MSWLFGKKKHRESPPETPSEAVETPAASDDSFIFIERRNNIVGPNSDFNAAQSSRLYPLVPDLPLYPEAPAMPYVTKQNSQDSHSDILNVIPFKLCKQLEKTINQDFDIDKLRTSEIMSFIKRIDAESYDYEFQIERSVVNEMNSQISK